MSLRAACLSNSPSATSETARARRNGGERDGRVLGARARPGVPLGQSSDRWERSTPSVCHARAEPAAEKLFYLAGRVSDKRFHTRRLPVLIAQEWPDTWVFNSNREQPRGRRGVQRLSQEMFLFYSFLFSPHRTGSGCRSSPERRSGSAPSARRSTCRIRTETPRSAPAREGRPQTTPKTRHAEVCAMCVRCHARGAAPWMQFLWRIMAQTSRNASNA